MPAHAAQVQLYTRLGRLLDALSRFGHRAEFMNFGLLGWQRERLGSRLARSVIAPLRTEMPSTLVDIGCGRCGLLRLMVDELQPALVLGVDLFPQSPPGSPWLCTKGDATRLPLRDGVVDAVTCVESSHAYSDLALFTTEVSRVLRPGGLLSWADFLFARDWDRVGSLAPSIGLEPISDADITNAVLRARSTRVFTQLALRLTGKTAYREILGLPGSKIYEMLETGTLSYRHTVFRRSPGGVRGDVVVEPIDETERFVHGELVAWLEQAEGR